MVADGRRSRVIRDIEGAMIQVRGIRRERGVVLGGEMGVRG